VQQESGPRVTGPVALLDWDNTLHHGWTLEPWVRFLVDEGVAPTSLAVGGERLIRDYLEGRLAGHSDLAHRANTLYATATAGWRTDALAALVDRFAAEVDGPLVYPFVPGLLAWLVGRGIEPVIVTGAPAGLVEVHVAAAGARVVGLTLASSGGLSAGVVERNPGTGEEKARAVAEILAAGGEVALGAGDSESDLPLLRAGRRQLVVGNSDLARQFPETSLLVEPRSTSADDLCRRLDRLF
jgi:phosphoserine phosphatase